MKNLPKIIAATALAAALSLGGVTFATAVSAQNANVQNTSTRTPVSYAQLLADRVAYENSDVRAVAIYARHSDAEPLAMIGQIGTGLKAATDAKIARVAQTGTPSEDGAETLLALFNDKGVQIGVLAITYDSPAATPGARLAKSVTIRDYLGLITPKIDTLYDPYMKGFDATDTLAQRINQTLLARHPDVNVVAIHVTAPGEAKNRVWGINRPNFIGRDSDEIDTDTEKTGRIVMQVIPATHRMEVHMPLLSPSGKLIGTLCTVYFWRTPGEAADYYGRSLSMMEEARQLTPESRDDLFKP